MAYVQMCVVVLVVMSQLAAGSQISSNSVLVALLDSGYTELSELVEKALLLQRLEEAVTNHNITIFAPRNEALERELDPEFKRFLLEPRNLHSLQTLLLHHIVPTRLGRSEWPEKRLRHDTLSSEPLHLSSLDTVKLAGNAEVVRPDDVFRPDGIIHGINRLLIPKSVQQDFNNRRSLRAISALKPEGAPVVDPRTNRLKRPAPPVPAGSPPVLPIYYAMAPGPSLAPAPAPGPGGPHHHFDGESQVKDFIHTLLHYGGYNEMADILVNLTNLATEMAKLVSEGYVLTVLAPNDEAMAKLTADQLAEPGAPEKIIYYHIIPEYQTEESMYNAVRRFGKIRYDTLHLPHKVVAREADGSVKFGDDEEPAYLFDPDIYTDGRISVQGIDGVLFPAAEKTEVNKLESVKSVNRQQTSPESRREQNNELLMKNQQSRPTGALAFPEANATNNYKRGRGRGRGRGYNGQYNQHGNYHDNGKNHNYDRSHPYGNGRGRGRRGGRGRGVQRNNDAQKYKSQPQNQPTKQYVEGNSSKNPEDSCYRCGSMGHWSRTCRTPQHLVKLYKESLKGKEKEVNLVDDLDFTNTEQNSDFFNDLDL